MSIPQKVINRISAGLKKFTPVLESAKSRDVNESDTVVIIMDMLQDVFGYDKYSEITSEHAIRGTFCDLAIKIDSKLSLLIEVKAIGLELKDGYVKQAIDYAANQGVDWVALTNGNVWRVYKLSFTKPINYEVVVEFSILGMNVKDEDSYEQLWYLCKEGWIKSKIEEFHQQKQLINRYTVAAVVKSGVVIDVIRREIKRISDGIKVESETIEGILINEVLKRDVIEGDRAEQAKKMLTRAANKSLREGKKGETTIIESAAISLDAAVTDERADTTNGDPVPG